MYKKYIQENDKSATDRGLVSMPRAFKHDIHYPVRLAICVKRFS